MKIPVIKHLTENHSLSELQTAEEALMNEHNPEIPVEGEDEGEQLTHVLAAVYILQDMAENSHDFRSALRNYSKRVRNSIE